MEGKSEKAGTDIFQKRCYKEKKSKGEKKVVEMRRHWSVFAPTQHHFHCTCNQVLHKAFWGTQVSPFLVGKSQCITTGTLTTPSLYCILQIIFQCFWTLWIQRTCRGITHGNVMNLWHHDSFFFCTWAGPRAKWPTRLITLRSRLVRCFHLASFRVRFLIRALPSIPHFIISFQPTLHLLSVNLFPFQDIARVHPGRAQWFGKFFLLVSLDWFFAQAMCKISMSLVW